MAAPSPQPYFDILPDEILVEILIRLPQNLIHRYRCVSKRWFDVTSSNNFIRCLLRYYTCLPNSKPPFALYYQNKENDYIYPPGSIGKTFHKAFSENPLFKSPGFSLSFITLFRSNLSHDHVNVLSSSKGLVLCNSIHFTQYYYVCNPLTKQYITVPPPPTSCSFTHFGFICKPTISGCSFHIVHPSMNKTCRKLEVYDSEMKEWTVTVLDEEFYFDNTCYSFNGEVIVCNDLLHWKNSRGCIFVYDPYNGKDFKYKTIRVPNHETLWNTKSTIGACKEKLRYLEWGPENFNLWELEDYNTGKWKLIQEICVSKMETEDPRISNTDLLSLAIHPFDEDIVFLEGRGKIIWCDIRIKKLFTVCCLSGIKNLQVFPVALPWWPVQVS